MHALLNSQERWKKYMTDISNISFAHESQTKTQSNLPLDTKFFFIFQYKKFKILYDIINPHESATVKV